MTENRERDITTYAKPVSEAQYAFSQAFRRAYALSDKIEKAEKRLAKAIARNRERPAPYWEREIAEEKHKLVHLRRAKAEADAAVETARENLPLSERE